MNDEKSFFIPIPEDEWERKYKLRAEQYDAEELKHVHAQDLELTGELLKKIADAEKNSAVPAVFSTL